MSKIHIQELQEFIQYTLDQEEVLTPLETQKQDFKKTFLIEKEYKCCFGLGLKAF